MQRLKNTLGIGGGKEEAEGAGGGQGFWVGQLPVCNLGSCCASLGQPLPCSADHTRCLGRTSALSWGQQQGLQAVARCGGGDGSPAARCVAERRRPRPEGAARKAGPCPHSPSPACLPASCWLQRSPVAAPPQERSRDLRRSTQPVSGGGAALLSVCRPRLAPCLQHTCMPASAGC